MDTPDGLPVMPALHCLGPFLGEAVLAHGLQSAHELTVDNACEERIELAGSGRNTRLIEQREALRDLTCEDEAARLRYAPHRGSTRIKPGTDVDGASRPFAGALEIAGKQPFVVLSHS